MPDVTTVGAGGSPVALTIDAVVSAVHYPARKVHHLVRQGRFPAPIDQSLPTRSWRWSPSSIAAYVAGEWMSEVA